MKQTIRSAARRCLFAAAAVGLAVGLVPHAASAATQMPAPAATVSFTFDDGLSSAINNVEPVLAAHGLTGTDYIITGCVGMTTAPNSCRANNDATYMTWAQIQALQNSDGWEIGSHTVDHDCLASNGSIDPDDCQRRTLTPAQVTAELSQSQSALAANGINATDFAPPYGDYSNAVLAQIAKYYATMRGFKDQNNNVWPYDDYLLNDLTVQQTTNTVADVESKIDQAIADNRWLVLTFHDVVANPSSDPDDYQYGTAELDQIAAYVAAKQDAGLIRAVNVDHGLVSSDTNLLANGTFNDGISDGWQTDDPADITADAADNGSYPDATNAVKLVSSAGGTDGHLFSPKVTVDPRTTYVFKNFLNMQSVTSGVVAYYVDEYDLNGNWISGQYLKQEDSPFVEDMNFTYKPSSVAVASASLQIIVHGSGVSAYVDNSQMFPATQAAAAANLLPNATFDDGLADGWSTDDPQHIVADAAGNGSPADPTNSIALAAGSGPDDGHLFSPPVAVSAGHNYDVSAYVDVRALTSGELGFYVDEYNADGDWISGQYLTAARGVESGTLGFVYTPSSSDVHSAGLQVIVPGGSGVQAYLDDAGWSAQ